MLQSQKIAERVEGLGEFRYLPGYSPK